MNLAEFTPTQRKMLAVLADGMPHTREELRLCLRDNLLPHTAIHPQLSHIRKLLRQRGQTIVCELVNRRICYRHIRLLTPE